MMIATAASSAVLYVPLLAKNVLHLDLGTIGVIGAIYGLAVFISSYIFGRAADIYNRKIIIVIGLVVSAFAFLSQGIVEHFHSTSILMVTRALAGFSIGIANPALAAYVYESRHRFGRFLSFGSLGYGIGSGLAGAIALYLGGWLVFLFASMCLFSAFAVALLLPKVEQKQMRVKFFPRETIRKGWPIYVGYFLRHTGASAVWIIFSLFILKLGANYAQIGILTAVNSVCQFMIMNLVERWDCKFLINLGTLVSIATFIVYTLAPHWEWLIIGQVMIAFAWSCMYVGSNVYLLKRSEEHATASGLLQSSMSLANIVGPIIGGTIAGMFADELLGYHATMYGAAILSAIAFLMFYFGIRKFERREQNV
jgi:MFS family permease